MLKNTDGIYIRAKEYQDKRAAIVSAYEKGMNDLEKHRGSLYFDEERKKLEETRAAELMALKTEYAAYFDTYLKAMDSVNGNRSMEPPTEEELRTLQLLKMKDTPTEAELMAAANTLKGNSACLSVLTEIGHKAGYFHNFMHYSEKKEMPMETATQCIKELADSLRDFLDYDTTAAARRTAEHHAEHYGTAGNETRLAKRPLFDTKEECFQELGLAGDPYISFCNAVD